MCFEYPVRLKDDDAPVFSGTCALVVAVGNAGVRSARIEGQKGECSHRPRARVQENLTVVPVEPILNLRKGLVLLITTSSRVSACA